MIRQDYYSLVRKEVIPLVPPGKTLLDVGCGTGATSAAIKRAGLCEWTIGVEAVAEVAALAEKALDRVYCLDVERDVLPIGPASVDVVLCLDVLEHLVDPWKTVRVLTELLVPGGVLVASIPNVSCVKVVLPLLFADRWTYKDKGILDRTHLRFFTRESAIALAASSGLRIDRVQALLEPHPFMTACNLMTFRVFQRFVTRQYLIRARKIRAHSPGDALPDAAAPPTRAGEK